MSYRPVPPVVPAGGVVGGVAGMVVPPGAFSVPAPGWASPAPGVTGAPAPAG